MKILLEILITRSLLLVSSLKWSCVTLVNTDSENAAEEENTRPMRGPENSI